MKAFATLFQDLDQTSSTNEKVHLMAQFFRAQTAETNAWALYFLAGRKPKKLIGAARLRTWAEQETGAPAWLMDECYAAVGDTAEMIALMLGAHRTQDAALNFGEDVSLGDWMSKRLLPLSNEDESEQRRQVVKWWNQLETNEIFIINKFLTGGLRVGVSETLVYRALAEVLELPRTTIASRLLGSWTPSGEFYETLKAPADSVSEAEIPHALPKPFCLAAPIEDEPSNLGDIRDWQLEWKWDGIRCQIVKVGFGIEIWSRGEERITETFPDIAQLMSRVPGDWILDGELVAGDWRQPGLFQDLQKRLGRKKPSALFQKDNPVSFLAYDLLQENTRAWSNEVLQDRRQRLEEILNPLLDRGIGISEVLKAQTWEEAALLRTESRARAAEGLMVKRKTAVYETGRKRGIWFKWKIDPLTVDAVLTAAQPGTGRRASLYTDYTFSIWRDDELVPIAKAYSGLTDQEIRELDQWIRQNTTARFGPVRALKTQRVFEIGFEGIAESTRHKSGIAVRFPRILRERTDKKPADADRVETVRALLDSLKSHHTQPVKSLSDAKSKGRLTKKLAPKAGEKIAPEQMKPDGAESSEGQLLFDLSQTPEPQ